MEAGLSPPRVVFLSSTHLGKVMLAALETFQCAVVFVDTANKTPASFPDYDIGLSFLYTHRIPPTEFDRPYRWVNFHPGPLPEMRGRCLAYNAIMHKAKIFGASVHYMDETYDTGEIIETLRFPIAEDNTAGDLVTISHSLLVALFFKYVPALLCGKVQSQAQGNGTYYRRRAIPDEIKLTEEQNMLIRAITAAPKHYPKVNISGKCYRIIPEK